MRTKNLLEPRFNIITVFIIFLVLLLLSFKYYLPIYLDKIVKTSIFHDLWPTPLKQISVGEKGKCIPLEEAYKKPYNFGRDAFTGNINVWNKVLQPYKGRPGLNYLEIGVFEGRSLIWMLENILTDSTSRATAVDIFGGPSGDYEQTYRDNLKRSGSENKVTTIKDFSQSAMRTMPFESYDIIYIDGSHLKNDVLEDAVLAWRLVKPGGLIIFDDYRQLKHYELNGQQIEEIPKMAIDPFVQCFDKYFDVIHNEYQLVIKRKI